jgi:hypothetical protein
MNFVKALIIVASSLILIPVLALAADTTAPSSNETTWSVLGKVANGDVIVMGVNQVLRFDEAPTGKFHFIEMTVRPDQTSIAALQVADCKAKTMTLEEAWSMDAQGRVIRHRKVDPAMVLVMDPNTPEDFEFKYFCSP